MKIKVLHHLRNTSSEIELVSTTVRMAEVTGTVFTEIASYAFAELVADIGGSLGLVLGLRFKQHYN